MGLSLRMVRAALAGCSVVIASMSLAPGALQPGDSSSQLSAAGGAILVLGDYLLETYADALVQAKHPSDANTGPTAYFARVEAFEGDDLKVTIGTFHDGEMQFRLHRAGSITFVYPQGSAVKCEVLGPARFSCRDARSKRALIFKHVGTVETWLAVNWFAGEYLTSDGKRYVFGNDGRVEIDGVRSEYAIGWDDEDTGLDDFLVLGETRYRFVRTPSELLLYKAPYNAGTPHSVPDLRLRRKTGA